MRSGVLITNIVGLVIILGVNQRLKVRHGAVTTACGWIAPASYADYSTAARTELRSLLAQHGFKPEPSRGRLSSGLHSAPRESDEWFIGRFNGSLPFHIDIRTPQGDSSGLLVEVVYDYHDYSWRVTATEKQVKAFTDKIVKWWSDYQDQHPGGPPGPNHSTAGDAGSRPQLEFLTQGPGAPEPGC